MRHPQRRRPEPLRPDRLRTLERPFGWIPFRILSSGWLQRLGREAKLLYFFLCLVADGRGISYYGDGRLCRLLGLSAPELAQARDELCRRDLLAFDGRIYQLLSLPHEKPAPDREPPSRQRRDPQPDRRGGDLEQIGRILQSLAGEE